MCLASSGLLHAGNKKFASRGGGPPMHLIASGEG